MDESDPDSCGTLNSICKFNDQQVCPATANKIARITKWIDEHMRDPQHLSAEELLKKIRCSGDVTRVAAMNRLAHLKCKTLNAMAPELIALLVIDPADWSLCDRANQLLKLKVDDAALVSDRVLTKIHEVLQVEDLACREDVLCLLMRIMGAPGGMELISVTPAIGDAVVEATTNFRGEVLNASNVASEPMVTLAETMIATIEAPDGLKKAHCRRRGLLCGAAGRAARRACNRVDEVTLRAARPRSP